MKNKLAAITSTWNVANYNFFVAILPYSVKRLHLMMLRHSSCGSSILPDILC